MKISIPIAPEHLSVKSKGLWQTLHKQFVLEAEAAEILRVALENLDLADQARALLRREGLVISDDKGTRKHPASDVAKQHDSLCLRAFRQLGLDLAAPGEPYAKRKAG